MNRTIAMILIFLHWFSWFGALLSLIAGFYYFVNDQTLNAIYFLVLYLVLREKD